MSRLLSCPFCREIFPENEGPRCPACDLPLVDPHRLPPSAEARAEEPQRPIDPPEDVRQSWFYWRRGRGPLLGLAIVGLGLFFAPWVRLGRPDPVALSAFDLARGNLGFLWGGAVGWFILVPLVASRRSVSELRGARVIAFTFSIMTVCECALLFFRPPQDYAYFSAELETAWGLGASALISVLGAAWSLMLGGSLRDLRDLGDGGPNDRRPGEAVH